jgi:hypothetical protein
MGIIVRTINLRPLLAGYSLSEFKTLLKRSGYQVPRNLHRNGWVAIRDNRYYRFRWWDKQDYREPFQVDISEPIEHFDRWANSTERTVEFNQLLPERKPVYRTLRQRLQAAQHKLSGGQ